MKSLTLTLLLIAVAVRTTSAGTLGIDANYALEMEARKAGWHDASGPVEPFAFFAKAGCEQARIRLWTGDDGTNGLTYATETARRAQAGGLKPYLVIFLSEEWADLVKQPAPAIWKDLALPEKIKAVEAYSERVTRHFAESGVKIDVYEIGNEIDFGICGEFEPAWPHRVSLEYMRRNVWPLMAEIIRAAEDGVRKAQPGAKFILHLSQWNNVAYCTAFWEAMLAAGVQLDFPGLSYFPSSVPKPEERSLDFLRQQAANVFAALKQPVVICETGYPAAAEFPGQFATWNQPAAGYPLTSQGQAKWIADFAAAVRSDAHISTAYYWSPEWYGGGLWDAFALFDATGAARPGAASFRPPPGARRRPSRPCA